MLQISGLEVKARPSVLSPAPRRPTALRGIEKLGYFSCHRTKGNALATSTLHNSASIAKSISQGWEEVLSWTTAMPTLTLSIDIIILAKSLFLPE